jgi:methyl-accepting chemotaxis protein
VTQINRAMTQVDRVTQRNAAASEELSSTSEELSSQAQTLRGLMEFFKSEDTGQPPAEAGPAPPIGTLAPAAAGGFRRF